MDLIKLESEWSEVAACRACLETDSRLFDIRDCGLLEAFDKLAGTQFSILNGVYHLCPFCCSELSKFAAFRDRCQRIHELLEILKEWGPLTMDDIRAIDRDSHKLSRNLIKTDVEWFDSNKNIILSSPVKIENDIDSVFIDPKLEELINELGDQELEDHDEKLIEEKLINNERINKDIEKNPSTLEERKLSEDLEDSDETTGTNGDYSTDKSPVVNVVIIIDDDDDDQTTLTEKEHIQNQQITEKEHIQDEQMTKDIEKKPTTSKKRKLSGSSKAASKATKIDAGNNRKRPLRGRKKGWRKIGDDIYPYFDYKSFENEFKVKIKFLNINEQKADVEARKLTSNYLESAHRCETCGKGFTCLYTLTNHKAYHDQSTGPFECEICHFRYPTNSKCSKHRNMHRLKFTCEVCGHVTRNRELARLHFKTHTGKTYPCPHCGRVYKVLSTCVNHMRFGHPELSVACDQCGDTFQSRHGLRTHKTLAHRENTRRDNFKCSVCDVNFSSLEALDKHTSTAPASHTAVKPCVVCGESCDSAAALDQHTALRHPPDQYRCDECDTTFSCASSLGTHIYRKHSDKQAHWKKNKNNVGSGMCEICGLTLKTGTLKIHMLSHKGYKPYKCSECPKSFPNKTARAWHVRTHTGEKPYLCDQCPTKFSASSNLNRHRLVVHLNQRLCFPCSLCKKTFTTRGSMQLHVNTVHHKMPTPKRNRRKKAEAKN